MTTPPAPPRRGPAAHVPPPAPIQLPKRKPRRNETRELTRPIEAYLNAQHGVRVGRNNSGMLTDARGGLVRYGLGVGSADLVGICTVRWCTVGGGWVSRGTCPASHPEPCPVGHGPGVIIGRSFSLEVKRPGQKPGPDQVRWMQQQRNLGGFAAIVTSLEDAQAAVERCRAGASE